MCAERAEDCANGCDGEGAHHAGRLGHCREDGLLIEGEHELADGERDEVCPHELVERVRAANISL